MVLSTKPYYPCISPFPNPSHLLPSPRRSRRSPVSCSGGGMDRRSMLLGLGGGLYGASNYMAYGAPIQPPDLSKCSEAHDLKTQDILSESCCPPISDDITDYVLPSVKKLRVRPAAHLLGRQQVAKYEEAVRRMRALDKTDPDDPRGFMQQANIHCAYCNGAYKQVDSDKDISVHFSWLFYPFHRWYLYFYERILGSLICDPTFALPFWNWDNPFGMRLPEIYDDPNSPLFDAVRNPCHRPPQILDLSLGFPLDEDEDKVISSNLGIVSREMLRVTDTLAFMGQPFRAGETPLNSTNAGTVEAGSHTAVHRWVGDPASKYNEDLGNFFSSGRDPAFYTHHANVDRLWSIWTKMKTKVPKTITDPDYLNAAFLFYDENKKLVRVKVADALDHTKMGYTYQRAETPWMHHVRPRRNPKLGTLTAPEVTSLNSFPLTLDKAVRVRVAKTAKGKAEEALVLENIEINNATVFIKFDVFVNDEDDNPGDVDRAEYAGSYSQLPHKNIHSYHATGSLKFSLTELYDDIGVHDDDDEILVTIVPRYNGRHVIIGGIKIVSTSDTNPNPNPKPTGEKESGERDDKEKDETAVASDTTEDVVKGKDTNPNPNPKPTGEKKSGERDDKEEDKRAVASDTTEDVVEGKDTNPNPNPNPNPKPTGEKESGERDDKEEDKRAVASDTTEDVVEGKEAEG